MGSRDKGRKEIKKPKKDGKAVSSVLKEPLVPTPAVEVVKRKRKEREPEEE